MKLRLSPPRLNVDITGEQEQALRRLMPHGTKRIVFGLIIDDLISALEKDERVLGAFMAREIKTRDVVKGVEL